MQTETDTLSSPIKQEIVQCPSCDTKLQSHEMAKHYEQEMDQLRQSGPSVTGVENVRNGEGDERRKPWSVFQKVQKNRQSRLKQRTRKRTAPAPSTEQTCPLCNLNFPQEEIQQHADQCARRSNGIANGHDEHSSNEDDDDEYEEYEWAGQKRIRASSLLEGGYAAIGVGQPTNSRNSYLAANADAEEEDLNVEEDDTRIYGPSQYDESDMIPTNADQSDTEEVAVTSYMRRLITAGQKCTSNVAINAEEPLSDVKPDITTNNHIPAEASSSSSNNTENQAVLKVALPQNIQQCQQIIESLKARLAQYENHVPSKFKCLICLDDYRNPAISVSCWHVHCEECWLRSLGARKLCPQCNLITAPKDLRRIYM